MMASPLNDIDLLSHRISSFRLSDDLSSLDLHLLPPLVFPKPSEEDSFRSQEWFNNISRMSPHFRWMELIRRNSNRLIVKAVDLKTQKLVIVKFLCLSQCPSLYRELRLAASLHLPHTLPVERFSLPELRSFGILVFPFVQSRSCHPKSWQTWLRVLSQLFETLMILHANGYAHLDINPSNILLEGDGKRIKVWLIDFGVSAPEDRPDSEPAGWAGTLPYVDPVLIKTGLVSSKADVWGVGVMLATSIFTNGATFFSKPYSASSVLADALLLPERIRNAVSDTSLHKKRLFHQSLAVLLSNLLCLEVSDRLSSRQTYLKIQELMKENCLT